MPAINDINYTLLPQHMQNGMQQYIEQGRPLGGFLYYILVNDFVHAVSHADDINKTQLLQYADFLYNQAPAASWGTEARVEKWITSGGYYGIQRERDKEKDEEGSPS
jgi:hypothetical protein